MRRYQDFLDLIGATTGVQALRWAAPDSVGAYLALRVDADAVALGLEPALGLTYIRQRRSPGGVRAVDAKQPGPVCSGRLGTLLTHLNLERILVNGDVAPERVQRMLDADPLLRVNDGTIIDLRMAAASVLAMLTGAFWSPARDLAQAPESAPGPMPDLSGPAT